MRESESAVRGVPDTDGLEFATGGHRAPVTLNRRTPSGCTMSGPTKPASSSNPRSRLRRAGKRISEAIAGSSTLAGPASSVNHRS